MCADAHQGGEAVGPQEVELLRELCVSWHLQWVSTAPATDAGRVSAAVKSMRVRVILHAVCHVHMSHSLMGG